MNQIVTAVRNF